MEPVSFSDITADVNPEEAIDFLETWFLPDDLVAITVMRVEKAPRHNLGTQAFKLSEWVEDIRENDVLRRFAWSPDDGAEWRIYFGLCPVKREPSVFKRGNATNVARIPGYWIDIDVKEGSFKSQAEAYEFLTSLPCIPTIIADSGSGVHAYWCFDPETAKHDEYGPEAWWAYIQHMAGDREVDKLSDLPRIFKLPGSIAFAKEAGDVDKPVKMIYNTRVRYNERELRTFSEPYYQEYLNTKREARSKEDKIMFDIEKSSYMFQDDSIVSRAFKSAYLEEKVNEYYSWEWLLPRYGWSKNKEQRDGSIEWTRPGEQGSSRSAVTDFEGSNVMSLLTSNPITRLLDLRENGIPITVFRAMLRLRFDDDVDRMMKVVLAELETMGAWN